MLKPWQTTDSQLFFSKKDPKDIRLGDCVQSHSGTLQSLLSLNPKIDLALWGYPDDEGIKLNGGRIGAARAPEEIRRVFYKMTPHVQISKHPYLMDFGNVDLDQPLIDRHQQGSSLAEFMTENKIFWAALGGGHDYGYADGSGFLKACLKNPKKLRPIVINFDAHLDVRPTDKGLNSGTPFFRLLTEFGSESSTEFEFFEVGLQPHCNSQDHWAWAQKKGAHLIPLSEIEEHGFFSLKSKLQKFLNHPIFISLDIDALQSAEAPGCSQSWTTGLKTTDIMSFLTWVNQNFQWQGFSIYEVSPTLDFDNRTSKLSAQFLHHALSLKLAPEKESTL